MNKKNFSKFNNKYEIIDAFRFFFFAVIAIFAVSMVFNIVINIIALLQNISFEEMASKEFVQVLSYALSSVTLIVFFFIYNSVRKIRFTEAFSDGQKISLLPISVSIVLAIIAIFLFTPFMNLVDYFFQMAGYSADKTIFLVDKMSNSLAYFGLGLLIYALLPAIAEEIVFRGVIQRALLSKFSGFVAVTISTLLFVLMHGALQQTVYQLVMGIILGFMACVAGNILYSIILHFLNNALVILFSCFDMVAYLNADYTYYYNIFSIIFPICIFLLGLVLVGILFWVMKFLRNKNFFRYETKKERKLRLLKQEELREQKPLVFKDFWSNITYKEKVFLVASVSLVGILWLINTINGFIA